MLYNHTLIAPICTARWVEGVVGPNEINATAATLKARLSQLFFQLRAGISPAQFNLGINHSTGDGIAEARAQAVQ